MMKSSICILIGMLLACTPAIRLPEQKKSVAIIPGAEFYRQASAFQWKQRDSFAVRCLLDGSMPAFLKRLHPVHVAVYDSASNLEVRAVFYVTPDYLSIGHQDDWARIPLTPMAAQKIADSLECFLPTRKMVNDIFRTATVRLRPVPFFALRDSTPVMYHHHLVIEGQRKGKKGLIAGIKKDVVISGKILRDQRPERVAIYGWHEENGKPIQPLYTGHVNWYVDYSHGIRLVYRKIKVGKRWMDYTEILSDPLLRRLLCDEEDCDFYKYPY
jgi:hypothetical protein